MSRYTDFLSRIKRAGFSQPNRYKVFIDPPNLQGGSTGQAVLNSDRQRQLSLMCQTASLPGINLATTEAYIYGPPYNIPYNQVYDDVTLVFLVDAQMNEKQIFDNWANSIINPETKDANFYKEYVTDITIEQLDRNENPVYSVKLIEAYPTVVNELGLDSGSTDEIHRLAVTFSYRYWTSQQNQSGTAASSIGNTSLPGQSFLQQGNLQVPSFDSSVTNTVNDLSNSFNRFA